MKVQVLGSGSCRTKQPERKPSGYVLETPKQNILIDTGTGITTNFAKSDHTIQQIDAIINTHRHPDHISDLTPIIQEKIVNSFEENEEDIKLLGPKGHQKYLENRIKAEMQETIESIQESFGFKNQIQEISPGDSIQIEDILIEAYETQHGPEGFQCLSLRITNSDKDIFFTGDTDYFSELANFANKADMIIADCSKPNNQKAEGHMTPEECVRLAEEADANKLVLSHLYPEMDNVELQDEIPKTSLEIVKAEDLMKLEV